MRQAMLSPSRSRRSSSFRSGKQLVTSVTVVLLLINMLVSGGVSAWTQLLLPGATTRSLQRNEISAINDTGPLPRLSMSSNDSMDSDNDHNNSAPECSIQNLEDCLDPKVREKMRMEAVRMLQDSFYQSSTSSTSSSSSSSTISSSSSSEENDALLMVEPTLENGGVLQLPLWRVPWTEVPGRTNVLSVHEPMYTNMFEELIRSQDKIRRKPRQNSDGGDNDNDEEPEVAPAWYFGHLYVPKDEENKPSLRVQLHTYEDILEIDVSDDERSAAVLGTLMKITDYRRMEDGKLLLLVQAVERFVVTEILQEKPYGRALVQLLPDREEIHLPAQPPSSKTIKYNNNNNNNNNAPSNQWLYTEQMVQPARASAVVESWQQWHPYEYEATPFPLPSAAPFITTDQVVGSALAKVLPYAPFDTRHLPTEQLLKPPKLTAVDNRPRQSSGTVAATRPEQFTTTPPPPQKPLEVCLLEAGIFNDMVGVPDSLLTMPLGELEINLWLALNDYLVRSRTPVSPVLLGLLPVGQSWPSEFVLERIADAIQSTGVASNSSGSNSSEPSKIEHKYRRVSPLYPSLRRQKRLAYCAAQLLERRRETDRKNELRQKLLQIPSTKLRLAYILWMFETEFGAWM